MANVIKFVTVLAVLTAGCGAPECGPKYEGGYWVDGVMCSERLDRELTVSSEFSPEHIEAIVLGAYAWEQDRPAQVRLRFRVVDGEANVRYGSVPFEKAAVVHDNGDIVIERSADPTFAGMLVRHELGHSFGLGHNESGESVMHPVVVSPTIGEDDLRRFDELWRSRR